MYIDYFKLHERPFSIAPDPRYLYMSARHQEALAHLLYGVRSGGGFVALTGEVGTGKTTLCYSVLEQLPEDVDIALLLNPRLNAVELLASLCDELSVVYPQQTQSLKTLTDALSQHLLAAHAQGRRTVVIVDEAQNLSFDVLEQLRLLTNLETTTSKLLQIILVGQPELNQILSRKELRQLTQRITARYHLLPLTVSETEAYIQHRLNVSGGGDNVFSRSAIRHIHQAGKGIPRLINIICDRALLGAYTRGQKTVNRAIARRAAKEVVPVREFASWPALGLATLVVSVVLGSLMAVRGVSEPGSRAFLWPDIFTEPDKAVITDTDVAEVTSRGKQVKPLTLPKPAMSAPVVTSVVAPVETRVRTETAHPPKADFEQAVQNPELSLSQALNALYTLWDAHDKVQQGMLNRLAAHSDWNSMLRYNRPLVLELTLKEGDKRYVTLASIDQGRPVLLLGQQRYTLHLEQLLAYWQGYYALFWQPPFPRLSLIKPGDQGPSVVWLRKQLRSAGYASALSETLDVFDAALKEQIMLYQRDHHLNDDGLVGARTMIQLNNSVQTPAVPQLIESGVH